MTPHDEQTVTPRPRTRAEIEAALGGISPRRQAFNQRVSAVVDGALSFIQRHWLALVNGALIVFIGIAALAPIGYSLGLTGPSAEVFTIYRFFCGQTPSHSFYIAGYQMCLCSRCLAIYSSLLAFGLLLALIRYTPRRGLIRPISWKLWVLGMIPMALDGGTQLFGLHESNLFLRLLTGIIFGAMTAWFILPQIEESSPAEPQVAHA
ncbi:MAG TPA: DUF2085 domain-containing protein [Ktedonobacterales bacterium]|jgi:uncharacterized membrane protein|nr:DUF2085 domain-containing protein [Ktedonobacterales bacterium]HEX5572854.1 DUF2085 domain-containing protein [Ktedonobacterales bacterium]